MKPAEFLEQLRNVKPAGAGWSACCPAHEDNRASLSVSVGDDGRVLLRCFAGCSAEQIVKALGLGMADLFAERNGTLATNGRATLGKIVATYDYRDERGELLCQVVRYDPKDFRQRRPGEAEMGVAWIWDLKGVRRVLYRLPELLAADPALPVYVTEGEKDVEVLRRLSIVATTNIMGAGKWRSEYAASLHGRHVVILPDNDEPGRKHAQDVARSLLGVAASVKILEFPGLPAKGDVGDWLAAGGSADELRRLTDAAPEFSREPGDDEPTEPPSAKPQFEDPIPFSELGPEGTRQEWLHEGILAPGNITLFTSLWKAGKSTFIAHLLRALGGALDWIGLPTRPAKVLLVSEETKTKWIERRDKLGIGDHVHAYTRERLPFKGRPDIDQWKAFVGHLAKLVTTKGFDAIIIDTLSKLSPVTDENDSAQMLEAIAPLYLITNAGAAVELIHHPKKGDAAEGQASRGSGALPGAVDIIIEMRRVTPERSCRQRVLTSYSRYEETPEELVIELSEDGDSYRVVGSRLDAEREGRVQTIIDLLPTDETHAIDTKEILAIWPEGGKRPGKGRLGDILQKGINDGDWKRSGAGTKGDPFRYRK